MAKNFGKRYFLYVYTLVDNEGNWEQNEGEEVINVGISTNPKKMLWDKQSCEKNRGLMVLLIKKTTTEDYNQLINTIEELRTYKSWFLFEPLAKALKRKIEEVGFKPHTLRSAKKTKIQIEESHGQLPL